MIKKSVVRGIVVALLAAVSVIAQTSTSTITGLVTDPSGAVVANAKIEAKNEETGVNYAGTTTGTGNYSFASLTPGPYTVTVTQPGFQTYSSVHNILTVGTPLVVDVTLKVGVTGESVQVVESGYERIETSNAAIGDVVTTKQVQNLPLNGRNPLSLLTLEPGVVQRTNNGSGSGTHVFGSRDRAHNVTIDGIDANESTVPNPQSNLQRLNPDNVQEFRTITLGATAENGRNSGANVIVSTRAGGNDLHGSVFYFNRNSAYNANEWFANYERQQRPDLKLHEYGFDVGGHIIKNKTFFFGSFQNNLIKQTQPIAATNVGVAGGAPLSYTALARSGIFRFVRGTVTRSDGKTFTRNSPGMVDAAGNLMPGIAVCAPGKHSNCVDSYNMFDSANDPNGIGPDAKVLALIKTLPVPNGFALGDSLNTAAFNWNAPAQFKGPHYMVRVDHTFGPNDNMFVRYLWNRFDTTKGDFLNSRPSVFPGFPPLGEVNRSGKNLSISYRHMFTPSLVNDFTFGFNRFAFLFTFGESNPSFGDPTKLPPWTDDCVAGSFQNVDAPNCVSPHTQRAVTTPQFVDNLSWIHGAHTLHTGFNFRFYIHNDSRGFFGGNIVTPVVRFNRSNGQGAAFANFPRSVQGDPTQDVNSIDANRLQQAIVELAGIPNRIQQAFFADFGSDTYASTRAATVYTRAHQYNSYIQDEWKLKPNLTLNAGLRWEFNPPPYDAKQALVPNVFPDGSQGDVTYVKSDRWFKNNSARSLGPRVSIAWSPDKKTAVRAGYAWLFDTLSTFQVTAMAGKVPGFLLNCQTNITTGANGKPAVSSSSGCADMRDAILSGGQIKRISQGFPVSVPLPTTKPSAALLAAKQSQNIAAAVGAFDPNIKNPSVHEWDLTIQRELPLHFIGEIGYVGKRGTHLYRAYDLNQVSINGPGFLDAFNVGVSNRRAGCDPDGTKCSDGRPRPAPQLLVDMVGGTAALNNRRSDFDTFNIGAFANFADQQKFQGTFFRPNAQFGQIFFQDSGGDSYYHGLFIAARRRFEQGLDFGFSYTFSKSIDVMSVDPTGAATGGALSTSNSRTPTDIHDFRLDRALSDFNNTHVLLANMLFELPFGHGKKFASDTPGWLNQVIGGWTFTGIFNYQSGEPYSITSGSLTGNGGHVSYAQVRGPLDKGHIHFVNGVEGPVVYEAGALTKITDPNPNCVSITGTQTSFCIPLPGQNGNGRNIAQGPNFWNLDSGLLKNFGVTERIKLQFRAEFFNVLNHANWENPRNATSGSNSIQSTRFGQTCCISSSLPSSATVIAIGEPNRVIQLGLKLNF
ncbi:MAG TPA: TonB-dependent receptor [Candidatus Dormibacteraeota bacterium]|nr:TonB-dependent receptor [Candidatus Dormibacteraeota bacterium]